METLTPTDKVLYKNLGLTRKRFFRGQPITDPHDPKFQKRVGEIFPRDFISGEVTASMHKMGERFATALKGKPTDDSRDALIRFGVAVVPALEAITVFEASAIEHRMSLSIVAALPKIREQNGEPGMHWVERERIHYVYSEALQHQAATVQESEPLKEGVLSRIRAKLPETTPEMYLRALTHPSI